MREFGLLKAKPKGVRELARGLSRGPSPSLPSSFCSLRPFLLCRHPVVFPPLPFSSCPGFLLSHSHLHCSWQLFLSFVFSGSFHFSRPQKKEKEAQSCLQAQTPRLVKQIVPLRFIFPPSFPRPLPWCHPSRPRDARHAGGGAGAAAAAGGVPKAPARGAARAALGPQGGPAGGWVGCGPWERRSAHGSLEAQGSRAVHFRVVT